MECAEVRAYLLDFIYGELADEPRSDVAEHLASCAACRAEEASLRKTIGALGYWKEVHPKMDLIFVNQAPSFGRRILGRLSGLSRAAWKVAALGGGVIAVCLVLLALLHTELTISNGVLNVKMRLFGAKRAEMVALEDQPNLIQPAATTEEGYVRQLQTMAYVMESIIYASEQRQRRDFLLTLEPIVRELQRQRQVDIEIMQQRLNVLEKGR